MVKKILAKTYVYLILFLMYLPIFVLMIFSFTTSQNIGSWSGFSLQLYVDLFKNAKIMTALGNTMLVAILSAAIATIIGTLGAIGVFYSKPKTKKAMESLTEIPIVNAEIVMALSLAVLFLAIGVKTNFITLIIGHVVLTVAFVYLSVRPKLMQMDSNIYEAAIDLGATPRQALYKVILPDILPGIIAGFMLALTLSLDDYIITAYLRNTSFDTLSTYIQAILVKKGMPSELRALTTILFLIALLMAFANNFKGKKEKRKMRRKEVR